MKEKKLLSFILSLILISQLAACGTSAVTDSNAGSEPESVPVYESGAGKAVISEVMPKNKATVLDQNGEFTDWIEVQNTSGQELDLTGWQMNTGDETYPLDGIVLAADEIRILFAPVASDGEVSMMDANGDVVDTFEIITNAADKSIIRNSEGEFVKCMYPTPGKTNTEESYDALQSKNVAAGPLEISEVCVENFTYKQNEDLDYMDYVEIKNISGQEQTFSGWYLTDDLDEPYQYEIPEGTLMNGECRIIFCDSDLGVSTPGVAPFSLDSTNDQIYLIAPDGTLADFASLKGMSYGVTYGRCDDENGYFYFLQGTPLKDNAETRARTVCEKPELLTSDGVFNNVSSVEVEFSAPDGCQIYYTTDGSEPTSQDNLYKGAFNVSKTCIIKAVAVKEGSLPSPTLNCSYIINEKDTIPVVSVVSADTEQFDTLYNNGQSSKGIEIPGSISYYDEDGSFTIGAGIKMHGYSTLNMLKKNMSFKFRGCYGDDELDYDLFKDGGTTKFKDLLLRAGGDQRDTIVKNEVCLNLCSEFSDSVEVSRNKYVAVYVNGEYLGIYSLMEKNNENWLANKYDVKKSDVTLEEEPVYEGAQFRQEILDYVNYSDVTDPKVYATLCERLDIDSLIDWTILEGVTGNWDLESGNLRYAKVGDGKWKLVLYDLDQAFTNGNNCFSYVIGSYTMGALNQQLLKNSDYKQRFLERASKALKNELSVKSIWAEYERLADSIDSEVKLQAEKDDDAISYEQWKKNLEDEKDLLFEDYDWYRSCAKTISHYCSLTPEEEAYWFGEI